MMRSAISPRFAMRIFLNLSSGPEGEEPLAVLNRLSVLDVGGDDLAVVLRGDLVHQLHRLDDAEHLILLHPLPDFAERRRTAVPRAVDSPDDWRLDDGQRERLFFVEAGAHRTGRRRGSG